MFARLHGKGKSFVGVSNYLLHDKEASTSERVGWTHSHNIPVDDPQLTARIMAATALDEARLKKEANIAPAKRKPTKTVLHYSLSWHPDEAEYLTPDQMREAALDSLKAIGVEEGEKRGKYRSGPKKGKPIPPHARTHRAFDHQALIVCHTEEKHPHVHVVVNLVNQDNGLMLPENNSRKKLSKWAENFERTNEHTGGKIFCEQRVKNNAKRARGQNVDPVKNAPRLLYEEAKNAAEKASPGEKDSAKIKRHTAHILANEAQKAADHETAKKAYTTRKEHAEKWEALEEEHGKAIAKILASTDTIHNRLKKTEVWPRMDAKRDLLAAEQDSEIKLFEKNCRLGIEQMEENEKTLLGKAKNRVGAIKDLFSLHALRSPEQRLSDAQEAEKADMEQRHAQRKEALEKLQPRLEHEARQKAKEQVKQDIQAERARFLKAQAELVEKQEKELKGIAKDWKDRNAQRREAFAAIEPPQTHIPDQVKPFSYKDRRTKTTFNKTASNDNQRGSEDRGR